MATRCTIKIQDLTFAKVYKHWDGYPEHILPWLETFNKEFSELRGVDPEYKFAQLLRSSTNSDYDLDPSTETGWGVVPYEEDLDEDYEYTLLDDGRVKYEKVERG